MGAKTPIALEQSHCWHACWDVDRAKTVIVIMRILSPGFAGIPTRLFAADNALLLFADGKKAVADINSALPEGG